MSEVRTVLSDLKDDKGNSIADSGLIHSLGVDAASGIVSVKLNLSKDYRKARALISERI